MIMYNEDKVDKSLFPGGWIHVQFGPAVNMNPRAVIALHTHNMWFNSINHRQFDQRPIKHVMKIDHWAVKNQRWMCLL